MFYVATVFSNYKFILSIFPKLHCICLSSTSTKTKTRNVWLLGESVREKAREGKEVRERERKEMRETPRQSQREQRCHQVSWEDEKDSSLAPPNAFGAAAAAAAASLPFI